MQILPTITTITPGQWRQKLKEIKELKLKEVAVFPTCLDEKERKELFSLLEETDIKRIPLVHLRSDMALSELDYLVRVFKTEAFNIHTGREYPPLKDYGSYRKIIYIENTFEPFDEDEIKEFGGICLDFAHLENDRLFRKEVYKHNIKIIEKYPRGCNHISGSKDFVFLNKGSHYRDSAHPHFLKSLSELDYLQRYPLNYFSTLIALELENTITEQLKTKEYLTAMFNVL
ncbi:MAG: hypothetical protein ABIG29_02035 [Candidatus Nealsonbacteria bacterium]